MYEQQPGFYPGQRTQAILAYLQAQQLAAQQAQQKQGGGLGDVAGKVLESYGGKKLGGYLFPDAPTEGIGPVIDPEQYGAMLQGVNATSAISPVSGGVDTAMTGLTGLENSVEPASQVGALGPYAPYLGGAAVLGGAYGLNQAMKSRNIGGGAMAGAGIGGGLAALAPTLGLAAGPVGWGVLGLSALGGALLGGGATGLFGNKMRFKHEYQRAQKLRDAGLNWNYNATEPQKGRSKAELLNKKYANDFVGMTPEGFVNNKFSQTRNEADLQPEDIMGYSFLPETLGAAYANASQAQQRAIAQAALGLGVREHTGEMDWANKASAEALKNMVASGNLGSYVAPQAYAPKPTTPNTQIVPWFQAEQQMWNNQKPLLPQTLPNKFNPQQEVNNLMLDLRKNPNFWQGIPNMPRQGAVAQANLGQALGSILGPNAGPVGPKPLPITNNMIPRSNVAAKRAVSLARQQSNL